MLSVVSSGDSISGTVHVFSVVSSGDSISGTVHVPSHCCLHNACMPPEF